MAIYDLTVQAEFADVPGVVRLEDCQHLWYLDASGLARTVHWQRAFELVGQGADVALGIEPDISEHWPHPTDPSLAPIEAVRETHRILAGQLEPLCKLAKKTGARVWAYRLLSPKYKRGEHIANDPRAWQRDVEAIVGLAYNGKRKTLAKLLAATGGGELCDCYLPAGWNGAKGWQIAKGALLIERQQAMLARLGINAMPLLKPFDEEGKPLDATLWAAQIFAAKSRGQAAVWNGPHHKRDKAGAILGPWYPPIPASLKVPVR